MPSIDNPFSEEYLDGAVERMRSCLRDLDRVADAHDARALRETCRDRLTTAARIFKELREEYDKCLGEAHDLRVKLGAEDYWAERYEYLVGRLADVQRGILTYDELVVLAGDVGFGEMAGAK